MLGPNASHNDITSICKHIYIGIRDGSLGTSTSDPHLHFALDLKINAKLNNNSSEICFKRGVERLMEEGITRHEQTTSALEFDEFESNRKVK